MTKKDVNNISDIEEYYSKARKIKFDDNVKITYVKTIIKNIFINQLPTYYSRNGEHCPLGRIRSINDYFLLCKYYFPHKSIKYFTEVLEKYSRNSKKGNIYIQYCNNIKKHNVYFSNKYSSSIYFKSIFEQMNRGIECGFNKKYSLNEIMNGD